MVSEDGPITTLRTSPAGASGDAPPPFTLDEIARAAEAVKDHVVTTPVVDWRPPKLEALLGYPPRVSLKLELFQVTGTFKPRGALNVMLGLDPETRSRGVTAVSAGNHAIAVAYAAKALGVKAKVVMYASANPMRVAAARSFGAEVILEADHEEAFALALRIADEEGYNFIHPFEGPRTALGTAGVGLELVRQLPTVDAVIIPIGGGGLAGGMATAIKQAKPDCLVYGVEPENADTMNRSFEAGEPVKAVPGRRSIADSLSPPFALPYSFGLCARYLDGIVRVTDDELCAAARLLFTDAKLAVEPAGAASTAALLYRLSRTLEGKHVALVVCGTNIDLETFTRLLSTED